MENVAIPSRRKGQHSSFAQRSRRVLPMPAAGPPPLGSQYGVSPRKGVLVLTSCCTPIDQPSCPVGLPRLPAALPSVQLRLASLPIPRICPSAQGSGCPWHPDQVPGPSPTRWTRGPHSIDLIRL